MSCSAITVPRGDTYRFRVFVLDANQAPLNLDSTLVITGAEFSVRTDLDAVVFLIQKTLGAGVEKLPQSGDTIGALEVTISPTDSNITPGTFVYDLRVLVGSDKFHVLLPAEFIIVPTVNYT